MVDVHSSFVWNNCILKGPTHSFKETGLAELLQHEGHRITQHRITTQNRPWHERALKHLCAGGTRTGGEMPSPGGATSVCLCRDDSTGEMEDQHPSGLHRGRGTEEDVCTCEEQHRACRDGAGGSPLIVLASSQMFYTAPSHSSIQRDRHKAHKHAQTQTHSHEHETQRPRPRVGHRGVGVRTGEACSLSEVNGWCHG